MLASPQATTKMKLLLFCIVIFAASLVAGESSNDPVYKMKSIESLARGIPKSNLSLAARHVTRDLSTLEKALGTKIDWSIADTILEGKVIKTPWPGPYWPSYLDGINYEWDDYRSPVKKVR
jgi:hypothetical protein